MEAPHLSPPRHVARHPLASAYGALLWAALIVGGVLGAARLFGGEAQARQGAVSSPASAPAGEAGTY